MARRKALWISLLLPLLVAALRPLEGEESTRDDDLLPAVPEALREALMAGRYDAALADLAELRASRPEEADFWVYLEGVTHAHAGRHAKAVETLEGLVAASPGGVWNAKARFLLADQYRLLGRWAEAEAIFEAAAQELRSSARQDELARIYLRFADQLSTEPEPPRPDAGDGLDHERAQVLYARALELDVSRATRDYAMFRQAYCAQALERWGDAARLFQDYLRAFDPELGARDARLEQRPGAGGAGERAFEARLALGDAQLAAGQRLLARRTFEDLAAAFEAASEDGDPPGAGPWTGYLRDLDGARRAAAESANRDARYRVARTYVFGHPVEGEMAVAALRRFSAAFPGHALSSQASFEVGEVYRELGRAEDAVEAYAAFLASAPPTLGEEEAREEDAKRRRSALFLTGQLAMGQREYGRAIELFEEYARRYPTGPEWAWAQQGIVDCEYQVGMSHRADDAFGLARTAWEAFLQRHPLDPRAQRIQLDLGELSVEEAELAEERGAPREELRALYADAVREWAKLVAKYPGGEEASQALFRTGEVHEESLGDLGAAIDAYRRCTFGSKAGEARLRLARMTEPALALTTERTWRSDEPARVRVQVRNVESLAVDVYPLDLEAYFKKHLTYENVEDLDLDLIAPARSFEVDVEGYADFLPLEQDVELPVEGPGVWAVAVSSETMRATTLVLRGDLDVIVKSSRREAFVFAQDMRRGAPAANVGVLAVVLCPDDPLFLTGTTDADGVVRLASERLQEGSGVRVLAQRDGHFASHGLSLEGLGLAAALEPRGHVSTDRPAYRPGDRVRWRAIVREVAGGQYTFAEGADYTVEIEDAKGRVFHRERLGLSRYGTLAGELELPGLAAVGDYTIRCQAPNGPVHAGGFRVEEYRLKKVELELDPERDVVYRGEEVAVEVRAAYYYGEPLSDSPLRYVLPDGTQGETRTGADGRARFTFGTRDFVDEGALGFSATLTEEQVSESGSVYMATRGFAASLELARSVVLAGEPFEVRARATAPTGEALATALTLDVLRRESDRRGRWAEVRVERIELETDAESGSASRSLAIDAGGSYVLRVAGIDRFDNPITAEAGLFVSGEEDEVQLRLLIDRQSFEVGESASLGLVSRAGAGLALVTFEAETVLGYRLVQLAEGSSSLDFTLGHEHFPNVVVAVARMDGNRFHSASVELAVSRRLVVDLRPAREVYAPGEKASVELTVTDQLGAPVEAELSLAVVDAALLELHPDRTPDLREFFERGTRRDAALATQASCTFRYDGVTRPIAQEILDERERAELEGAWAAERATLFDRLSALGYVGDGPAGPSTPGPGDTVAGARVRLAQELRADAGADDFALGAAGGDASRFGGKRGGSAARGAEDAAAQLELDTAFWSPSVVTDPDGRAQVSFTVPKRSTRWRVTSRGASPSTLLGEAQAEFVSKADFFVELRTPAQLTEGDRPRFLASVHNLTGAGGTAHLRLRVLAGDERWSLPADVELGEQPVVELLFDATEALPAAGELRLELEAEASLAGRELEGLFVDHVAIRPFGVEVEAAASGTLTSSETLWLELPGGAEYSGVTLDLLVGPSVDRMLVDAAAGEGGAFPGRERIVAPPTLAAEANDLLGVCAVLEHLQRTRSEVEYADLVRRGAGLAARLSAAQRSDGGWAWSGQIAASDPHTSARAVLALVAAQERGLAVPPASRVQGLGFLEAAFRATSENADEAKAMLLHALAAGGRGDFGAANRLHRLRSGLSPAALAYTTLALVEMERAPMAAETAAELARRAELFDGVEGLERACRWPVDANLAVHRSDAEMAALALLALERATPEAPEVARGARYLLARRPWPAQARGLVVAALASHRDLALPAGERVRVTVAVGDEERVLDLSQSAPGSAFSFPVANDARQVRVELTLAGRGEPHYTAVLRGFTRDVRRKDAERFRVTRQTYRAAPPVWRGKEIPTGFGVLRDSSERWINEVANLPRGKMARASVQYYVERPARVRPEELDYLILEVPLPAGTSLLEGSVRGTFQSFEERGGRLVVHVGQHAFGGSLEYTLVGALPGAYRVLPASLRSAYEPGASARGDALPFRVLGRGETSPDEYRRTPDELYHLGLARYAASELDAARELLSGLYEEYGDNLEEQPLKEVASRLLFLAIERGDAPAIVRFFEILKEKDPELLIPFHEVLAVGRAYRELEEFERALLIFRATIEETFGKDLKVAGTLEEQQETSGALDTLERLWLEFPDLPPVVEAYLALSDKLLALAPRAHEDESLRRAGRARGDLSLAGIGLLQRFLSLYPEDPLAPEAGLNLVSAHLDLEDYATASRLSGSMAALYTEPGFADAFKYTRAVAEWHQGSEPEALRLLQQIADAVYTDELGRESRSENRDLALYILGQIYHARQDAARASEYYERVAEVFADAREALAGFREKRIALDEVTTARPGAPVELELRTRNLEEAELLVYAVDLLTLYLRERNLSNITEVNLAGISPTLRKTVELDGGSSLREAEHSVALELEEPGAYLVICRGEALHTSGLVLVSDLEIDVREDPGAGRLRVQASRAGGGAYLRGVDVRVVGSQSSDIVKGKTDPRGLFVASGVLGRATVIARLEGEQYAFFRGSAQLGEVPQQQEGIELYEAQQLDGQQYLQNVLELNDKARAGRQQRLEEEIQRERKGVQVKQVK